MTGDKEKQAARTQSRPKSAADERQERLRAALRANLRRRKEQSRGRSAATSDEAQSGD